MGKFNFNQGGEKKWNIFSSGEKNEFCVKYTPVNKKDKSCKLNSKLELGRILFWPDIRLISNAWYPVPAGYLANVRYRANYRISGITNQPDIRYLARYWKWPDIRPNATPNIYPFLLLTGGSARCSTPCICPEYWHEN